MVLLANLSHRRIGIATVLVSAVLIVLLFLYPASRLYVSEKVSKLPQPWPSLPAAGTEDRRPLEILPEYQPTPPQDPICRQRFSYQYLEDFRDHAASYCNPGSRSNITCFHTHARADGVDSLCIARGVGFDVAKGKFSVGCSLRDLTKEETDKGLIPFPAIRGYWYNTGLPHILDKGVDIYPEDTPITQEAQDHQGSNLTPDAPQTFLLLKREGEGNTWHSLLEIFSTFITFDVLQISRDPSRGNKAFFRVPEDVPNTQVIILDDRKDGPYFDLWTLFAQRQPLRLKELIKDEAAVAAVKNARIIMPLTGSASPVWQSNEGKLCTDVPTVSVFSRRVLDFYNIPDPPTSKHDQPITVTFVDREWRRLVNQTDLFAELQKRYPRISVRLVDFAAIPFSEQLRVARETDILVGVHGAGLTHILFMREGAGAVVEIQPKGLDNEGYHALSTMRRLSYFRTHGDLAPPKEGEKHDRRRVRSTRGDSQDLERREWHLDDVRLEFEQFMNIMDAAIKSVYSTGLWNYDID